VCAFLSDQLVKVLALGSAYRVDLQRSVMEMGMDSLMAMEFRNRIQSSVKVRLAVVDLLKGPSVQELASIVLRELGLSDRATGAIASPAGDADAELETWVVGSP
jgi:aryl carrier-like protein